MRRGRSDGKDLAEEGETFRIELRRGHSSEGSGELVLIALKSRGLEKDRCDRGENRAGETGRCCQKSTGRLAKKKKNPFGRDLYLPDGRF